MADDEIKERIVYVLTRKNKADDGNNDIYVGSTENNRLYKRMKEVGLDNWEILPLLSRTCDIKEIREAERNWLGILQADLNTVSPIISKEEKKVNSIIYRRIKVQTKRYYCSVCEISCESKSDLKRHFDTYKHL